MERRLAAILAADVVGYSRLMGADEAGTLAALRKLRAELFGPVVAGQRGKVIKSMGDGWLVEFVSSVAAVSCALQVQDRLAGHETIKLRIGVHIGDVVHEAEDIFGNAVNVAARLQEVSDPGGVAISEAVYSSLDGTLSPSFEDTGLQELKNIERPVQIWMRARQKDRQPDARGQDPGRGQGIGFPSLAIEPVSTSDDRPEVRELADALTSDLATYLGSSEWLMAATAELTDNQNFALRATLRSRQERLRLEARLIDSSGNEIWAEKYDGELADSFDWQDRVGEAVASTVLGLIRDVERQQLATKSIEEMSAEECLLYGILDWNVGDAEAVKRSLGFCRSAIEKDPTFIFAYGSALSFLFAGFHAGYKDAVAEFLPYYGEWLEKVSSLPSASAAEEICIALVLYQRHRDETVLRRKINELLRRAPFSALVLTWAGWGWVWLGEPERAIDCFRKFERLGRFHPHSEAVASGVALALVQAGRDEAVIEHAQKALEIMKDYPSLYRTLAAAYGHLGRREDASVMLSQLLRLLPDETISAIRKRSPFVDAPGPQRYFEGLRLAGLPE